MSGLLKYRQCISLLRKFDKSSFNSCSSFVVLQSVQIMQHGNCLHGPYFPTVNSYSFSQIREFAKRAGGKMVKSGKVKTAKLTDEEMAYVINIEDFRQQLNLVVDKLKKDYVEHLSLRSTVGNIENILVKIDADEYPLHELAVISKKNPNLIAINMIDFPEALKPTVQAILESSSALNPQQEGTMIYLTLPKVTREHRETLAKNAKSLFMKAKDEVRSVQNSFVKEAKGKTELSEDLVFNATNQIMAMAEQCVAELDKVTKMKQKELLGDN